MKTAFVDKLTDKHDFPANLNPKSSGKFGFYVHCRFDSIIKFCCRFLVLSWILSEDTHDFGPENPLSKRQFQKPLKQVLVIFLLLIMLINFQKQPL